MRHVRSTGPFSSKLPGCKAPSLSQVGCVHRPSLHKISSSSFLSLPGPRAKCFLARWAHVIFPVKNLLLLSRLYTTHPSHILLRGRMEPPLSVNPDPANSCHLGEVTWFLWPSFLICEMDYCENEITRIELYRCLYKRLSPGGTQEVLTAKNRW